VDPYLSLFTKTNSKWVKDLNVRSSALKLLVQNIGEVYQDIGVGNDFSKYDSNSSGNLKNRLMGLYQSKILFAQQRKQ
jgi:hypothetical protein